MYLRKRKITLYDYFLGVMFAILCGFTAGGIIPARTYILMLLGLVHFFRYPHKYQKSFKPLIILVASFACILIIHYFHYDYVDKGYINRIILILCGFFVIKQLGSKFRYVYMKVMYYLAALSLICYIFQWFKIIPDIPFLYETNRVKYYGIFFWNVRYNEIFSTSNGFPRNCGPFWEPGAFSGYLLMVVLLYFNDLNDFWKKYRKESVILILAFITTFSTQGYVAAFVLALSWYVTNTYKRNLVKISFLFLSFVYIFYLSYESLPFMREKIEEQLEISRNYDIESRSDRFSTTLMDIDNIKRHPLIGCSSDVYLLYAKFPSALKVIEREGNLGSGSGMTSFMAQFGVPLLLIWLLLSFWSLQKYYESKMKAMFVCIFLFALGQGETYITQVFYLSIPFLFYGKGKTSIRNTEKNVLLWKRLNQKL